MNTKQCTKCKLFKPLTEFGLRSASADGLRFTCKTCDKEYYDDYRSKNKDEINKKQQERRTTPEGRKKEREYRRIWRKANPNKDMDYYFAKIEREPGYAAYQSGLQRYRKRYAMLPSLTPEQRDKIRTLYSRAKEITEETGIEHHIDHIIPLVAKEVYDNKYIACGLHVPWNLRIIPAEENLSKNCTYVPDEKDYLVEYLDCSDYLEEIKKNFGL